MRKLILYIISFILCAPQAWSSNTDWEKANKAYSKGKYERALALYQNIEKSGQVSSSLYYNIGNTYFRLKQNGHAILYFERALKMNPGNKDAEYNLLLAQTKTSDRIEAVPRFFLIGWWKSLADTMHPSSWGIWSLFFLILTGAGFLGLFYGQTLLIRKLSFWCGGASGLGFVLSIIFAYQTRSEYFDDRAEIITQSVVSVKGSPDDKGTNLFLLHEGTKINRMDQVSKWKKVQTADGNEGWIEAEYAEAI